MATNSTLTLQIEYRYIDEIASKGKEEQIDQYGGLDAHLAEMQRVLQQELYGQQRRTTHHEPAGTVVDLSTLATQGQHEHQHQGQETRQRDGSELDVLDRNHAAKLRIIGQKNKEKNDFFKHETCIFTIDFKKRPFHREITMILGVFKFSQFEHLILNF
jgi:hypothetical protein